MWRGIFSRRDPLDTVEKVDRQRYYQNRRLICGLHLDSSFEEISGALILVEGCGHWMRFRLAAFEKEAVPPVIAEAARAIHSESERELEAIADLKIDFTEVQSQLIWRLKAAAGKAADHVLAACIDDPGIWNGRPGEGRFLESFCAPEALAEKCGLTIIDGLPARDVAVGGNGYPFEPLPFWYIFADRNERVSQLTRLILTGDSRLQLTVVPPSDGLDRELPNVGWEDLGNFNNHFEIADTDQLNESNPGHFSEWIQTQIAKTGLANQEAGNGAIEWVVAGTHAKGLAAWLRQHHPSDSVKQSDDFGIESFAIRPAIAAILGIAHLDQMPMNLPSLTGAETPRILGRMTAGKPSNWRRVLMNMSDHRPPAMKLRDAI